MPIQCTVCTYVTDTHNWSHFVGKNEWNCINGPSESNRSCICMLECTYSILNVLSEGKTWRKSVSDLSFYIQTEPPKGSEGPQITQILGFWKICVAQNMYAKVGLYIVQL
jgi:hypothetical protein